MNRSELHFVQGSGINVGRRRRRHGIGQMSIRWRPQLNEMTLLVHIHCVINCRLQKQHTFPQGPHILFSDMYDLINYIVTFFAQPFTNHVIMLARHFKNFSPHVFKSQFSHVCESGLTLHRRGNVHNETLQRHFKDMMLSGD